MTDSNDHPADNNRDEQQEQQPPRRGAMRFQDADTSVPREPTLAEQRAMRRAREEENERSRSEIEEAERKSLRKRRVLIGAGVTVGIVATVAVWYAAATPDEVTASCVDDGNTLASDENICSEDYVRSHGGYYSGGFFYLPLGGTTRTYHYNYGGTVSNGRVVGGSTVAPSSGTTVKSNSGRTIQRGGFGVSGGGKSGGSGGSGGS
jgi:uncharacterized membrane protein YgcG